MSSAEKILIPDPENLEMSYLLRLIRETDKSIFLTGKAGTGKSTLLRYISGTTKKKHVILAPTGISALNAGGQTLHSFFRLPFGPIPPGDTSLKNVLKRIRKEQRKLIRGLELIIIDEVSMVRADLIDAVDVLLRMIRGRMNQPFGGVQMLFVGDLFQLEPVVQRQDSELLSKFYTNLYYYGALAFYQNDPIIVELRKVYRQKDQVFVGILDRIRTGEATQEDIALLNQHTYQLNSKREDLSSDSFNITLTTRKDRARDINDKKLAELLGSPMTFSGAVKDDFPESALPTDLELSFKVGAQVMFVANDPNHQWVNGSLGYFEDYDPELGVASVQLENGDYCTVEPYTWENKKYKLNEETSSIEEEIIGRFTQIPLKLAWAITIHKSQGLTFENVTIDFCGGTFAAGQAYVALSRCRSLEGMVLLQPFRTYDIITRSEVVNYYQKAATESVFEDTLEESRALNLYTSACNCFNKGDLEQAVSLLSEALVTKNLLDHPRVRKMLMQKLYQLISVIDLIKKENKKEQEREEKFKSLSQEFVEMGDQCLEEIAGEHAALRSYDKALLLCPNNAKALARKAALYRNSGASIDAIELLQPCYEELFRSRDFSLELGLAYADIQKFDRSFDVLSRLQAIVDDDVDLLQALVNVTTELGYKEHTKRYKTRLTRLKKKK